MVQDIQYPTAPDFCVWSRTNTRTRHWIAMTILRRRDKCYFCIICTNTTQNWDSGPIDTKIGKWVLQPL